MNNDRETFLITGGTGGIGYHSAAALADGGARVILAGRDQARGLAARDRLREATRNAEVHLELGDLTRRAEVERLGQAVVARYGRVDVLINNAGLLASERWETDDGLEADFAVNVAAPWWLTFAALPALRRAPHPRVVNLTGGMPFGGLDLANLQAERGFIGLPTYSHAKRAMEAMSQELRRRLAPDGVEVVVVHPGGASTSMTRSMSPQHVPWWARPMWPLFGLLSRDDGGKSAQQASRSTVWASTTRALDLPEDSYVGPDTKTRRLHRSVLQPAAQRRVVDVIVSASGGGRHEGVSVNFVTP